MFFITRVGRLLTGSVDSIYCVPLQTPSAMTKELKARAMKLNLVLNDVQIKHPLVRKYCSSSDIYITHT